MRYKRPRYMKRLDKVVKIPDLILYWGRPPMQRDTQQNDIET